jgi:hypothetical protein
MMQLQPDIALREVELVVGNSLGFLLASYCRLRLRHLIHLILIGGLLRTYI